MSSDTALAAASSDYVQLLEQLQALDLPWSPENLRRGFLEAYGPKPKSIQVRLSWSFDEEAQVWWLDLGKTGLALCQREGYVDYVEGDPLGFVRSRSLLEALSTVREIFLARGFAVDALPALQGASLVS